MLKKSVLKLDDFSGGLVTKGSELSLKPSQSPDCVNVHSDIFKSLQSRKGYAKVITNGIATGTAYGIYNYVRDDTTQFLMSLWSVSSAAALKRTSDAGTAWTATAPTAITVHANLGTILTDAKLAHFTSYGTDMIITTEGRDVPQKYDSADTYPTLTTNYVDIDWENSHGRVTGNVDVVTPDPLITKSYLKITLDDSTNMIYDDVDCDDDTSIADVVASINAAERSARITGDVATFTGVGGDKLTVTIDGTPYDDIDVSGDASINDIRDAINAATSGSEASTTGDTFLQILSTTSGTSSNCTIANKAGTPADRLFASTAKTDTGSVFTSEGLAYTDSDTYLNILSNTRGSTSVVAVADGSTDDQECTEILFAGTTATSTTITSNIAPNGKYCHVWHHYTWIVNTSTNPDRLYYSANANHISWTATDYQDIVTPGDIGITGMASLRGRMYVFKKHSIHRITYLGGTPLLDIKEVTSNVGTASPRSIRNIDVPGKGEMIVFLGTDEQLYTLDGYSATPVSESISTYNGISTYCMKGDGSTYGINPAKLDLVHSVNYIERHWYLMFFCKDNDTTPKDGFIYDYYANSFWPIHIDQDGTDVFHVSCISDNANGQLKTYVAGAVNLWEFDSGDTDDVGSIDAYWVSSKLDMGSEVAKKAIRNITLTTSSAAVTPVFYYKTDWETSWTTGKTFVTATREHTIDIPRFEELLQFKIQDDSTSTSFELIRASIIAQVIGQAK